MITQLEIKNSTVPSDLEETISSRCDKCMMTSIGDEDGLVSVDVSIIFRVVNFGIIVQIIDLFGTGTNIINIVCFVKQGLKTSGNISMLGLSISDLLGMVTLIWVNLCLIPPFYESDLQFDAGYIAHLTTGIQHVAFSRMSCWITAFITLERCLCIALPLQIKRIMTAKTAIICNITIFTIIYCGNIAPVYYTTRFATLPHARKPNTTWLGIVFTEDQQVVERYSFAINGCFLPFFAFTIISVSTAIMVVKLKSKSKWRKKSTAPGNSDSTSNRDMSVSKMVVMISVMFIICYTPNCVIFMAMIVVPEFSITGRFKNLTSIMVSFSNIMESMKASFNIFIYYNMSSRYRHAFRRTFCTLCDKYENKELNKTLL